VAPSCGGPLRLALAFLGQGRRSAGHVTADFHAKYKVTAHLLEFPGMLLDVGKDSEGRIVLVRSWKQSRNVQAIADAKYAAWKELLLAESCRNERLLEVLDAFAGDVPRLVFAWGQDHQILQAVVSTARCRSWDGPSLQTVFRQLLEGIAYLHSQGIVHQAIGLDSVASEFHGDGIPQKAFILDLSCVSVPPLLVDESPGHFASQAPELLLGSRDPNTAADVWSIGAIMATVILGKPFFEGDSVQACMQSIVKILGSPSNLDCAALMHLPRWSPGFAAAGFPASDWGAEMKGAGGILSKMLVVGWPGRRFFESWYAFRCPAVFPVALLC
jgi:hypothetical protein